MHNTSIVQMQHARKQSLQDGFHLAKIFRGTTSDVLTTGGKSQAVLYQTPTKTTQPSAHALKPTLPPAPDDGLEVTVTRRHDDEERVVLEVVKVAAE